MSNYVVKYSIKAVDLSTRAVRNAKQSIESYTRSVNTASAAQKRLSRHTREFSKNLRTSGLWLGATVTLPAALISKSMVEAASTAEETANRFKEVFSGIDASPSAKALENYGRLAESTSQAMMAATGTTFKQAGYDSEKAARLSVEMNKLAIDLASFEDYRGGFAQAARIIAKSTMGEREALKESLGVLVTEEMVRNQIKLLESQGNLFANFQDARVIATLKLIKEASQQKGALGDFPRTIESYQNQSRILAEQWIKTKEDFGKILLPMAKEIVKFLQKMVSWFSALSPETKKMTLVVVGLVAVLGPLLVLLGGIGIAVAVISAPMWVVIGAIAALTAAIGTLLAYKDELMGFFENFGKYKGLDNSGSMRRASRTSGSAKSLGSTDSLNGVITIEDKTGENLSVSTQGNALKPRRRGHNRP